MTKTFHNRNLIIFSSLRARGCHRLRRERVLERFRGELTLWIHWIICAQIKGTTRLGAATLATLPPLQQPTTAYQLITSLDLLIEVLWILLRQDNRAVRQIHNRRLSSRTTALTIISTSMTERFKTPTPTISHHSNWPQTHSSQILSRV